MGVGMAVRRRTHPCTRGAWLTLLLLHASLAGAPADFAATRWLFAYKALTSCRAIFRPRKAVLRRIWVRNPSVMRIRRRQTVLEAAGKCA